MFDSEKKYLQLLGFFNVPVLAIVLALNYLIDGASSHHLPDEPSLWPRTTAHSGPSKMHYLAAKGPEIAYFGSSRVEVGLPPQTPTLAGRSIYNAGLSASSFADVSALARHYLRTGKPRAIVVGIDFSSFTTTRGRSSLDYSLLADSLTEYRLKRTLFDLRESLAFGPLHQSFRAMNARLDRKPFDNTPGPIARAGQLTNERMEQLTTERGMAANAFQKKIELAFAPPPRESEISGAMTILEQLVALSCSKGVVTRVFINPQHALTTHFIRHFGAWDRLEAWKVGLATVASMRGDNCDLRIVDFSGYNSITSESITGLTPTRVLRNYWEASHYKSSVGEMILKRLFGSQSDSLPADFGRDLRLDTVRDVNLAVRAEQSRYMLQHAKEIDQAINWASRNSSRSATEVAPENRDGR